MNSPKLCQPKNQSKLFKKLSKNQSKYEKNLPQILKTKNKNHYRSQRMVRQLF